MKKNDLSVFKMEKEDFKITLKKGTDFPAPAAPPASIAYLPTPAPAMASAPAPAPGSAPAPAPASDLREITSPMVGTFYASPAPEAGPFLSVGQEVTEDTVVCIIEAMKVMNEIKAECRGIVAEIVAENGKPVQFGEVLFRLR